jgi:2-oxoglutarate dehydrogenase E2 component (dihydrolipoamide succinyltransferase)
MMDIEVPKLNNNDTSYVVVQWLVDDGTEVTAGQPVVVIETSKAAEELDSPGPGVLHIRVRKGAECGPGETIGHLLAPGEQLVRHEPVEDDPVERQRVGQQPTGPTADLVLTDAARALAEAHGITDAQLRSLGRTVIRTVDVEALVPGTTVNVVDGVEVVGDAEGVGDAAETAAAEQLPIRQRAVGAAVTESMRTIPAAAAYVKVLADAALGQAERLVQQQGGGFAGLPELVVKAVATLHSKHPLMFATLIGDSRILRAEAPNVGVTVDIGRGLHVPVIHDAAALTSAQIAERLARLRFKAMRAGFTEQELAGANILVALHNTAGIVLATPIVFPGQTCAVSLPDTQEELALADDGRVVVRRYVNIGVVYDHRVVNGRDAVAFLQDLKHLMETPESLI